MTTLGQYVKDLLRRRHRAILYECRRCGTSLDAGTESCPTCASTEIARYDIARAV